MTWALCSTSCCESSPKTRTLLRVDRHERRGRRLRSLRRRTDRLCAAHNSLLLTGSVTTRTTCSCCAEPTQPSRCAVRGEPAAASARSPGSCPALTPRITGGGPRRHPPSCAGSLALSSCSSPDVRRRLVAGSKPRSTAQRREGQRLHPLLRRRPASTRVHRHHHTMAALRRQRGRSRIGGPRRAGCRMDCRRRANEVPKIAATSA